MNITSQQIDNLLQGISEARRLLAYVDEALAGEVGEMVDEADADAELENVRRKLKEYWLRAVLEEAV